MRVRHTETYKEFNIEVGFGIDNRIVGFYGDAKGEFSTENAGGFSSMSECVDYCKHGVEKLIQQDAIDAEE